MYIKVRVKPDSKKEAFIKVKEDTFEVSVKVAARNGWANERVKEILQQELQKENIRLVAGHSSPNKIFSVED